MHHEVSVDEARLLELIGDDAADEVWDCVPQGGHEFAEGGLVELCHGGELAPLLPLLVSTLATLVVSPERSNEGFRGFLQQLHHGIVQGVFVLVEPSYHSVSDLGEELGKSCE